MIVWGIDKQYVDSYIVILLKQLNRSRLCRESAKVQFVLVCLQVSPHISKAVLHAFCCLLILFQKTLSGILVCLFVCLLLYVPSQQLWSLRDGQFT